MLNLFDNFSITLFEKPFCIPIPVPTAVPPNARIDNSPKEFFALLIDSSIWPEYPRNSCPNLMGVAS